MDRRFVHPKINRYEFYSDMPKKFSPVFLDNLTFDTMHAKFSHLTETLRNHPYYNIYPAKIFFITEGHAFLKVEDEEYNMTPGNFYIIKKEQMHSFYIKKGEFLKKYWFHVNVCLGNDDFFTLTGIPCCIKANDIKLASTLCQNLIDTHEKVNTQVESKATPSISAVLEEKTALCALVSYITSCFESACQIPEPENFSAIMDYIDAHYREKLTLKSLSSLMNMHPNYFASKFKRIYSKTPTQLIMEKKINKAKFLLTQSTMNISRISTYLGYSDVYFFSKQFKKFTGMSPAKYKKINSQ